MLKEKSHIEGVVKNLFFYQHQARQLINSTPASLERRSKVLNHLFQEYESRGKKERRRYV